MADNDYHFITRWRVESTVDEVFKILDDPLALMHWWPCVYLEVKVVEPGDEHGLGRVVSLYTKGWLPYTLRWDFRVTEVRKDGFTLVGYCHWTWWIIRPAPANASRAHFSLIRLAR